MSSDWANLPQNLLDSIVERFSSPSDYVGFSLVCMSWFGVAKHNQGRFSKKMLSHPEPPMLLFFNDKEAAWNLYNVVDNKVLDLQSKMPKRRFCGSSRGWLVHVEGDFTVTLTKPLFYKSNSRGKREDLVVCLPELNPPDPDEFIGRDECWAEVCEYFVIKATITADPILEEDECIVVLTYMNRYDVAFIRPSKDTTWCYLFTGGSIVDVLPLGGDKFYAANGSGKLSTFTISSKFNSVVKSIECNLPFSCCTLTNYLVDNGEKLLIVDRHYDFEGDGDFDKRFAMDFKVYEFDSKKCEWIEKETLGEDVAIFVGENRVISVEASKFPGCKQNCIYYNHDLSNMSHGDELLNDFGVYDMETKSISKPYSEHLMTLLSLTNQRPIWFTPNICL